MMNTLAEKAMLSGTKAAVSRGVRLFYKALVEPKSRDEDEKRKELIFNIIVTAMLAVISVLGISMAASVVSQPSYSGVQVSIFTFFTIFFASLLLLSRKGLIDLASHLFIGLFFLGAAYGQYRWGFDLPLSLLCHAVIIVISSILIGTKFGIAATVLVATATVGLAALDGNGIAVADRTWRSIAPEFKESIEHSFMYGAIMVVSWLSNREIERSLRRARQSEQALKAERDLLEQRIEERTRELKAAQLEKVSQLYRFAEFGRLSSGIFHDLLNPLTAVSLTVERLREGDGMASGEAMKHIDRAIKASRRMESFMHTVRKQLKNEERQSLFSITDEVQDAVDLLSHKAHCMGVSLHVDSPENIMLRGNPVRLFQVALNLMSNAVDAYAGSAGQDSGAREKTVSVRISKSENGVSLSVKDNGCGIPAELVPAIFDPFFTTKTDCEGIGIGLSTTKQIVENDFKGRISVKSEIGSGSEFIVDIPIEP